METPIYGPVNKKESVRCGRRWLDLPDEIVWSSILPNLSMKEVARTSLVSRGWFRYWRHISVLNFENPIAIKRIMSMEAIINFDSYSKVLLKERRDFVNWVDNILAKHMATVINQFKVTFYLHNYFQKRIDNWVVCAFSKHVQQLELDFSVPRISYAVIPQLYVLDKPLLLDCFHNLKFKPALTTLCLKTVNVTDSFVELLFQTCGNLLEKLSIEKAESLTTIKTNSNVLWYLKICDCANMKTIDIDSPKLVTLVYESGLRPGLELLRIANASCLSHVTIEANNEDRFFLLLRSLAKYFPQLEYLNLKWWLNSESNPNPVVDYFPVLAKLRHLDICVSGNTKRNIAGWIPFIQACPILQKLTMKLRRWSRALRSKNMKHDKHPLLYLKTFEIMDFDGKNVDVDVAKFVFENAVALQEVIVQICRAMYKNQTLASLKLKIPQTVKLIRTT